MGHRRLALGAPEIDSQGLSPDQRIVCSAYRPKGGGGIWLRHWKHTNGHFICNVSFWRLDLIVFGKRLNPNFAREHLYELFFKL